MTRTRSRIHNRINQKELAMKRFVTIAALTLGIQEVSGEIVWGDTLRFYFKNGPVFVQGKDHHATREAAVARANEMRDKKIASLTKQIQKLRKLTFK